MKPFPRVLLAFGVGWLAHMIEDSFTTMAWGGPVAILADWIIIVFASAFYAVAAVLLGRLLRLPAAGSAWNQTGYPTLLLAIPPASVLALSAALGLRTIDPVSHFSLMSFWPSVLCHFFIVFPFANLAAKPKSVPAPPAL